MHPSCERCGTLLLHQYVRSHINVSLSCTAHALQTTAGGMLGRDCQLRLLFECSYRHTRLSSTYSYGSFGERRMLPKQELSILICSTV